MVVLERDTHHPSDGGGGSDNPARDQAVNDISAALAALASAQAAGDFAAVGQAQADLQAAAQAYEAATGSAPVASSDPAGSTTSSPASPTG